LDISIGSWGSVGCYLAQRHPDASVVCVLSSVQEFARAKKFARELEVVDQVEFVLAETPEKLLTILSGFRASKFDRITMCGVVETVPDTQRTRFLRTLKRIQAANGTTVLEFSACTAAHMTTHAWTNKYVHSAFPCYAITLPLMRRLTGETGFTLRDTLGYSDHYERTFLEWNRRFQAQWGHDTPPVTATATDQTPQLQRVQSLPESFKRTWEFYLLHSAACYRSGALQVFQIRMG
jgi:cyclopropane-fatty-acyl-phospholipid synthase